MTTVILFVFGAIIGSFLNVLALRMNSGMTLLGRSRCAACGHKLGWHELVPILSFFFLLGRCGRCKARISWQYPLVEIWTGLIFATVQPIFIPVFCIYVAITIYDLRHKIIPDSLVYSAIILSLIISTITSGFVLRASNLAAGGILFLIFAGIWLLSRGKAMGFGDAKLGLSIGLLLGAAASFSGIILAFWMGAAYGIAAMIFSHKNITMKSEIPFAPFMVAGAWLALIYNLDLLHVTSF